MMRVLSTQQMQHLEQGAEASGVSTDTLMERAGLAVASWAWRTMRIGDDVLILVGSGNNGGDGLVAAHHLQVWGSHVHLYLCTARRPDDALLARAVEAGAQVVDAKDDADGSRLRQSLKSARLVVDAVLGTGRSRPLAEPLRSILGAVREEKALRPHLEVLAVDVPSGVDADTGAADPACVTADVTVALGQPKTGHLRFPAADQVGRLVVADIGIPCQALEGPAPHLVTSSWVREQLPPRSRRAHKGSFGRVLAVAGSDAYVGAAYLACMGAARAGAGYVTLMTDPSVRPILAAKLTEATHLRPPVDAAGDYASEAGRWLRAALDGYDALLIGCGLGQSTGAQALVREALLSSSPLPKPAVVDADALNALARLPEWYERLRGPAVVTPHPGELARLLQRPVAAIEEDRWGSACEAAQRWGLVVVLKGPFTAVASPEGDLRIIPYANPALATAGTGDVLAGVVAALLAQGMAPFDAASVGAFLHGAAGELVLRQLGDRGAIASDLLPALPLAAKALRERAPLGGVEEISYLEAGQP